MEGANVIFFDSRTYKTAEVFDEYNKWSKASFGPMLMSTGNRLIGEMAFPIEEKLPSVRTMAINHFKDLETYLTYMTTPEANAYIKDMQATWAGKYEQSVAGHLVVRRFKGNQFTPIDQGDIVDKDTRLKEFSSDNAPVVLLRGLGLTSDEWEKYDDWVNEWGYQVYIPLLLKIPGLIEYYRCWLSNISQRNQKPKPSTIMNLEYPQDLSIIYFENLRAYQNFLKSKELEAYNKTLAAAFPEGLNYKWNNTFRLFRRWSK